MLTWGRNHRLPCIVLGLVAACAGSIGIPVGLVTLAYGHEAKNQLEGLRVGVLDHVHPDAMVVEGTRYPLSAGVTVTNQFDRPVALLDLNQGDRVFFRLNNKGQIDKVVVWIPS